jgi:hypothetical protein
MTITVSIPPAPVGDQLLGKPELVSSQDRVDLLGPRDDVVPPGMPERGGDARFR